MKFFLSLITVCVLIQRGAQPLSSHTEEGDWSPHNPVPTLTQPLVSPQSTSEPFQLLQFHPSTMDSLTWRRAAVSAFIWTREMHQSSKQPLWATVVSHILSSLPLAASSMDITPPEQSHLLLNYNKLISLLTSKQKFPVKSLNIKIQVLQISGFTSRLKFKKRKNGKIY